MTLYPYPFEKHGDAGYQMTRLKRYAEKLGTDGSALVMKAYALAEQRHAGQVRDGGSPFIIHLIRTANILMAEWGERDASVIAAALLHDIIEDTHTTAREVKDGFGAEVGKLTDGMTMWKGSESPDAYFLRISRGPADLRRIKCADVIDNLRSWYECPPDLADKFPVWWRLARTYGVPMAETASAPASTLMKRMVEHPWYLEKAGMA